MSARTLTSSSTPTLSTTLTRTGIPSDRRPRAAITPGNPIKAKWKTLVNFFALPIRQYYLEPPGVAYRRRHNDGLDSHHRWPCPTYTGEVGDDEMILSRTHEHDIVQMSEDLPAAGSDRSDPIEILDASAGHDEDSDLAQSPATPRTPPNARLPTAFQTLAYSEMYGEPSPRYEVSNPMAELASSFPVRQSLPPQFSQGSPMVRHSSTPVVHTLSSSPSRPSFLHRRSRASSNSALSSSSLGGRPISEPLTATLVRSQYSYPKRGLTAQQMSFLSSVDSLGRFGVSGMNQASSMTPVLLDSPASPPYDHAAPDYGFPAPP